jgi:hypothetical protein
MDNNGKDCPTDESCLKPCPNLIDLETANLTMVSMAKRIKELESSNDHYRSAWVAMNSELQALKMWRDSVILAVTGEKPN